MVLLKKSESICSLALIISAGLISPGSFGNFRFDIIAVAPSGKGGVILSSLKNCVAPAIARERASPKPNPS